METVCIFCAIALSVFMEEKSAKAFEILSQIGNDTLIKVIRNEMTLLIHQNELVIGGLFELSSEDRISVDRQVTKNSS